MVLLLQALYGYPESPAYWETYCDKKVLKKGWLAIGPEWPSMYWHPELKLLMSIYVDDFKMGEPKENLAKGWALLRGEIEMEDPATPTLYLGCEQSTHNITMPSGAKVRMLVYDMEICFGSCVARYQQRAGSKEVKVASLPYLPGEDPPSAYNQATKAGLSPDTRTLPPDYNVWLKANGLEPVDMEQEAEDDMWVYKLIASKCSIERGSPSKESVEPGSRTKTKEDHGQRRFGHDCGGRPRSMCRQCVDENHVRSSNVPILSPSPSTMACEVHDKADSKTRYGTS